MENIRFEGHLSQLAVYTIPNYSNKLNPADQAKTAEELRCIQDILQERANVYFQLNQIVIPMFLPPPDFSEDVYLCENGHELVHVFKNQKNGNSRVKCAHCNDYVNVSADGFSWYHCSIDRTDYVHVADLKKQKAP